MTQIHIDARKWPDTRHWQYSMERLGEDDHGVWLYAPAETLAQRGDEPPRTLGVGFVTLVPSNTWWVVEFYWDHPWHKIYVNIGTPCEWVGNRVTQIDLDLDVVRKLDGSVEILDEDEFVDHQVRYGYPAELTDGARAATASAVDSLERSEEPFAAASDPWLALVNSR